MSDEIDDAQDDGASRKAATLAIEYARRLYDDILGWYHNADTKAQVILGFDGAFLALLAAIAFQKPEDLKPLFDRHFFSTWVLLVMMAVALAASMLAAIYCLWSRLYYLSSLRWWYRARRREERRRRKEAKTYQPDEMWFFQSIATLEVPPDAKKFLRTLAGVDGDFELGAMTSQIQVLAANVRKKHIAVNFGFVLTVLTLVLFACAAASYVRAQ